MGLAGTLLGVGVGLVLGALVGYRIGKEVHGNRRVYWALNVGAVLGCAALDFVGLMMGWYWLAYSAIGLMAGLITGMKYGYVDWMGVWRGELATDAPTDQDGGEVAGESPAESSDDLGESRG